MLRMLAWIGLLQDQGYVNRVLQDVGVLGAPYPFLSGKSWVLVIGLVYGYVPYMVLPLYAALDRLPVAQLEAARDLGASPARTFFRVTLPQTRQAILAGVIIAGLPMFGDYFTQQLLANTVGTRMIGNFIIDSLDVPIFVSRGSALILVLMALLIVPIVYYLRSTARAVRERAA
jgi:spermidine/putrescine transport system permease protein